MTAEFKADSINDTSSYVGNIKPGESGSVDAMITGAAPTMDDGKIQVIISYEDVNGEVHTSEQSVNLMVNEPMESMDDMSGMDMMPEKTPGFFQRFKLPIIGAGAVLLAAAAVFVKKHKDKKKQEKENDETI